MMGRLLARGEAAGRAAQRRRLEEIAGAMREMGLAAEINADSVRFGGRRMVRRWLADPLLRFAGRIAS